MTASDQWRHGQAVINTPDKRQISASPSHEVSMSERPSRVYLNSKRILHPVIIFFIIFITPLNFPISGFGVKTVDKIRTFLRKLNFFGRGNYFNSQCLRLSSFSFLRMRVLIFLTLLHQMKVNNWRYLFRLYTEIFMFISLPRKVRSL